jgi:hypothetical protein
VYVLEHDVALGACFGCCRGLGVCPCELALATPSGRGGPLPSRVRGRSLPTGPLRLQVHQRDGARGGVLVSTVLPVVRALQGDSLIWRAQRCDDGVMEAVRLARHVAVLRSRVPCAPGLRTGARLDAPARATAPSPAWRTTAPARIPRPDPPTTTLTRDPSTAVPKQALAPTFIRRVPAPPRHTSSPCIVCRPYVCAYVRSRVKQK